MNTADHLGLIKAKRKIQTQICMRKDNEPRTLFPNCLIASKNTFKRLNCHNPLRKAKRLFEFKART